MGISSQPEGQTQPPAQTPVPSAPTHCTVGGAHAFILKISSVFGLAPLRFESREEGLRVQLSAPMCLYSYVLVTILVVCTICGLCAEINAGVEKSVRMSSRMSQFVSTCDVLVVVVTAGAGVYQAPRRMRNMIAFMETVAAVDSSIGVQYSRAKERRLSMLLLAILIFFTVLVADDFVFYALQASKINRQWNVIINYLGFYLLWYIVIVLELQFAFTALSVRARFRAVNDALALTATHVSLPSLSIPGNYISKDKNKKQAPLNIFAIKVLSESHTHSISVLVDALPLNTSSKDLIIRRGGEGTATLAVPPCEAIRRLASLHGALCEVLRSVESGYGLPLVIVLISTLLHLIVTPYFFIVEIMVGNGITLLCISVNTSTVISTNRIHFLVLQFLWCVTHVLRIFVVVEPCHYTIDEGKRTERLVCRLLRATSAANGSLPARLEHFSRQLMLQSVCYSPMGLCTLGRPLLASVFGAVTTYLVILIQFQRYEV